MRLIGYAEVCAYRECEFQKQQDEGVQSWKGGQAIVEPHGILLQLLYQETCTHGHQRMIDVMERHGDYHDQVHLMQVHASQRPQAMKLARYCQHYTDVAGPLYIWQHRECDKDAYSSGVRKYRKIKADENDLAILPHLKPTDTALEKTCVEAIDPPPVFLGVPRLTVIAFPCDAERIPILMEASRNEAPRLGTALLMSTSNSIPMRHLFDISLQDHRCDADSTCWAVVRRRMFLYWQDVILFDGDYVQIYEQLSEEDSLSDLSTDVSSEEGDCSLWTADSASSTDPQVDDWTPFAAVMHGNSEAGNDTDDEYRELRARTTIDEQRQAGYSMPLDDQVLDLSDELVHSNLALVQTDMNVHDAAEQDDTSGSGSLSIPLTLVVSNISDAPPPVGLGVNREVDWLSSWIAARRALAEYFLHYQHQGSTHAPVHLIYSTQEGTFSNCLRSPSLLFSHGRPIEDFINWCVQNTGCLSPACSRIFCIEVELFQDVPSFVIVQEQPEEQVPLLVQVTDQQTAIYLVYQAYKVERVAGIVDWVSRQVDIVLPFDICYRGHRVQGGQDIPVFAGCVFQLRVRSWRENQDPLSITTADALSLYFMTHSTWEALPRPIGEPSSSSDQEQSGYLAPVLSAVDAGDLPQHTLEPRRPGLHEETVEEEGDDNIFFQIFQGRRSESSVLELMGYEETDYSDFERHWHHYEEWRRHVRRLMRMTFSFGLDRLQDEALAFRRARWNWPQFVLVVLPDSWYRGTPVSEMVLDIEGIVVYAREYLSEQQPHLVPIESQVALCAVLPFLTPYEQQGDDSLFLLVDPLQRPGFPVLLLEDHWSQDWIAYWPMKLPASLWTDDLLRTLGRLEECQEESVSCILTFDGQELPRMVSWQCLPGMKLNLQISNVDAKRCQEEMTDDEVSMMQRDSHPAIPPTDSSRGPDRQGPDALYDLVQREQGSPPQPVGGVAKFWLIPGEGVALHDAVIRLDLRPQVPDWTGWVAQSWRMAPTLKRFLPIRGRVTTISRERNDLLFLGTSQRDIGQGMRSILVDLVYSNVLRRGAIRCNILATVIEIARYFTSWRIPIDSPLLATFQLYWHDGSSWRVFQAFEVPTIPEGSFVQIVQASSPCSQYLITPPDPTLRVNPGRGDGGGRSRRPPEYYAIPDRIS